MHIIRSSERTRLAQSTATCRGRNSAKRACVSTNSLRAYVQWAPAGCRSSRSPSSFSSPPPPPPPVVPASSPWLSAAATSTCSRVWPMIPPLSGTETSVSNLSSSSIYLLQSSATPWGGAASSWLLTYACAMAHGSYRSQWCLRRRRRRRGRRQGVHRRAPAVQGSTQQPVPPCKVRALLKRFRSSSDPVYHSLSIVSLSGQHANGKLLLLFTLVILSNNTSLSACLPVSLKAYL